ncbi:adenosine receptor A1-like [Paramisgurnus dabryanus]|uniref:adenosine receptor A1-like n=1 Tax=Paramisgurnus dabryanus TaxID=90735 RepID=UPI003CCF7375
MAVDGRYIFIGIDVLIAIGCCLGNLLVIWAVWKSGALNQPTYCLIVSLAMADFLVGCVVVPLSVVEVLNIEMSFHACLFISCVLLVPLQASVLTLLAIALDRYLRVCIPFRYKSTVTKRRSWVLAAVCWMLACLLGFLPMYGWYNRDPLKHNPTLNCEFTAVISLSYMVNFIFFGIFMPLLAIMVALYCYIFFKVRWLKGKTGIAESGEYNHKEHKLAGSLVLVLALFVACWLPLHTMHAINFYNFPSIQVPSDVKYLSVIVSHVNSVVNPIVYALRIPKIKAEFMKIWRSLIGPQQQTPVTLEL